MHQYISLNIKCDEESKPGLILLIGVTFVLFPRGPYQSISYQDTDIYDKACRDVSRLRPGG